MATERKNQQGCWVIEANGEIYIESAELRALRLALEYGGTAKFVKYGHAMSEPETPVSTKPKSKPKPAPVPESAPAAPAAADVFAEPASEPVIEPDIADVDGDESDEF